MKIYFAASITGGREDQHIYGEILAMLRKYGTIVTEHVASKGISCKGEEALSSRAVFDRDVQWLVAADIIVAEVTTPSLGVGYELGIAEKLGKPVLCLFRPSSKRTLSRMISGNPHCIVKTYDRTSDLIPILEQFISQTS